MNSLKLQNHATLNLPCGHPRPCFLPHGSHRLKSQPVGLFSLCSILHNTFSPYAASCGLLFHRPHFHTLLFILNTRCCIAVFSLCNILHKSPADRSEPSFSTYPTPLGRKSSGCYSDLQIRIAKLLFTTTRYGYCHTAPAVLYSSISLPTLYNASTHLVDCSPHPQSQSHNQ